VGDLHSSETLGLIEHYLTKIQSADVIVLGCTHYPIIAEHIRARVPQNVKIIDSGAPVARYTKDVLIARDGLNYKKEQGTARWFASRVLAGDEVRWSLFSGQQVTNIECFEV
jgi:glutamate racemase